MSGKWTPGPRDKDLTGDGKRICIGLGMFDGPNGYDIAEVYCDDVTEETYPEAQANGRLIAAAPELAEALEEMVERFGHEIFTMWPEDRDLLTRAVAVLAKAKGEGA